MTQREVNAIAGRLSLRAPQTESLAELASAIEAAPGMLKHDRDASEVPPIGAQPWKYLLIPHEQVTEDKRITDFLQFEGSSAGA